MNPEQLALQKIIIAGLVRDGDQISFQQATGVITKSGSIYFEEKFFPSVSEWIYELDRRFGVADQQHPWTKATIRGMPLEHYNKKLLEADGVVPESKQNGLTDLKPQHWPSNTKKRKNDSDSASYDEESENRKQRKITGGDVTQHRYSSDAASFQQSPPTSASCKYPNCMVCNKGLPAHFNTQSPTWADILQVVLYALGVSHPQKEFFSLGKEIYDYVDVHWDKLSAKPRSSTWKQTAKMTLAHSRYANLFENGYDIFMKTGFWRLKKQSNPYEANGIVSTSRPANDSSDRVEELPSDESDHESRAERSWESTNGKLNSPSAYNINYLLADNAPQPAIPNLNQAAYQNMQMPPPSMPPQFYNSYNAFPKAPVTTPPSQFNSIKPNDFISQQQSNIYAAHGMQPMNPHHPFFSRRFSVDEGAKTLEDLRNASGFGSESDPNAAFYAQQQQQRLPSLDGHIISNGINQLENRNNALQQVAEHRSTVVKEESGQQPQPHEISPKQSQSNNVSPVQGPVVPQRRRSIQFDTTTFAVPESRSTLRSSNAQPAENYASSSGEQYPRSITLEEEVKSKNQLISKLYEELESYKKHAEHMRQSLDEKERTNKDLTSALNAMTSQLQKEQEASQMYQQMAKYNEDQRMRLEGLYKQMSDWMGRTNTKSPDQMRPYPFGSNIMNAAATPNGDVRTNGFNPLHASAGLKMGEMDNLRYS